MLQARIVAEIFSPFNHAQCFRNALLVWGARMHAGNTPNVAVLMESDAMVSNSNETTAVVEKNHPAATRIPKKPLDRSLLLWGHYSISPIFQYTRKKNYVWDSRVRWVYTLSAGLCKAVPFCESRAWDSQWTDIRPRLSHRHERRSKINQSQDCRGRRTLGSLLSV